MRMISVVSTVPPTPEHFKKRGLKQKNCLFRRKIYLVTALLSSFLTLGVLSFPCRIRSKLFAIDEGGQEYAKLIQHKQWDRHQKV